MRDHYVINGKIWRPTKSELVASWESPHYCNDFRWHAERLYRTPAGAWVLYGEGGAMSPYGGPALGGGRGYGDMARRLNDREAREWVASRAPDLYPELFAAEEL